MGPIIPGIWEWVSVILLQDRIFGTVLKVYGLSVHGITGYH